jgi:fluoroacetyl-CoA thioesterase
MIALMEVACARILAPFLPSGYLSVGVDVHISHTAATPPGARASATATYKGATTKGKGKGSKVYVFEVVARDEAGVIGKGEHSRGVIEERRLIAGAERRSGGKL